ncbi:hypothetical protein O9H85_22140 [Paenibacillus filicis]|uniref:Tetratricopeptide repeat protein n=1 Tax=Paenibacillus gyeongsangnamensis TaxID=3388067 RepID=A0ABT4QDY9_9BACL|nr:hypothetical protein [Paenibacillus filicis]MCZ8515071.1 hypothetical protein [Paenibacillus filicis]
MFLLLVYVSIALLIIFFIGIIKGGIRSLRLQGRGTSIFGFFMSLCLLFYSVISSPAESPKIGSASDSNDYEAQQKIRENGNVKVKQYVSSAQAKLANNDVPGAKADLKEALQIEPKFQEALDLSAQVDLKEKEALKEKNQAEAANLLTSAKAKLEKNDFNGARADLKQALSMNSGLQEANELSLKIDSTEKAYLEQQKQQEKDRYKADSKSITYAQLLKNSEALMGTKVKLQGRIRQIKDGHNGSSAFLDITFDQDKGWIDPVRLFYDKINANEGDRIIVWGEFISIDQTTAPSIEVKYMEKIQ